MYQPIACNQGEVPQAWRDKPVKLRQKDRDALRKVKFSKATLNPDGKAKQRDIALPAFGYKNHVVIDCGSAPRFRASRREVPDLNILRAKFCQT